MERGKVYPTPLKNISEAAKLNPTELWKQGYTYLTVLSDASSRRNLGLYFTVQPFHILRSASVPTAAPDLGDTATFVLKKDGKVRYVVVNGYVYDVEKPFVRKRGTELWSKRVRAGSPPMKVIPDKICF